jgi:hypothetical protein
MGAAILWRPFVLEELEEFVEHIAVGMRQQQDELES